MSAFMLSDTHINYLVAAASCWDARFDDGSSVRGKERELGAMLHKANCDSLYARYQERYPTGTYGGFKGSAYFSLIAGHVLAACACYDYQSCKVDDYDQTPAAKMIERIRRAACRKVAGFDDVWSIPDMEYDQRGFPTLASLAWNRKEVTT